MGRITQIKLMLLFIYWYKLKPYWIELCRNDFENEDEREKTLKKPIHK